MNQSECVWFIWVKQKAVQSCLIDLMIESPACATKAEAFLMQRRRCDGHLTIWLRSMLIVSLSLSLSLSLFLVPSFSQSLVIIEWAPNELLNGADFERWELTRAPMRISRRRLCECVSDWVSTVCFGNRNDKKREQTNWFVSTHNVRNSSIMIKGAVWSDSRNRQLQLQTVVLLLSVDGQQWASQTERQRQRK